MHYPKHIIKVLGAGCETCHNMHVYAQKEVEERGLDAEVKYISDLSEMLIYGYMSLPAIVIDEEVKVKGKMMSEEEVHEFFEGLELE